MTEEAKRMLSRTKELCYLTSFVIRLFEDAEKVCVGFVKQPACLWSCLKQRTSRTHARTSSAFSGVFPLPLPLCFDTIPSPLLVLLAHLLGAKSTITW